MPTRDAEARWEGPLQDGKGSLRTGTGSVDLPYSFQSRFQDGSGTNPEELLAAAHAGCYSMALANELSKAGHVPESVETTAKVHLEKGEAGFSIPRIDLITRARVDGIDDTGFQEIAEATKQSCIVSRVLAGAEIGLEATLET
jgi:osmotically inducible protein OsmC